MRKKFGLLTVLLLTMVLPLSSVAAEKSGMKGMDHGSMKGMDHDKMMSEEGMMMLGDDTEKGVKGMAHLKDVGEEMKKMGMAETHHFMVMFADTDTGKAITEGQAALKITGPDGKTRGPVMLMGMEGHFGADIVLEQKGDYQFAVGTKLADGQKRQFQFEHTLE